MVCKVYKINDVTSFELLFLFSFSLTSFILRLSICHCKVLVYVCRCSFLGDILGLLLSAVAATSGFPCPEHNFVTVGPNHSKLGMHVSGDTSVSMKHV